MFCRYRLKINQRIRKWKVVSGFSFSFFFRTKLEIRKKQITIECFNGSLLEHVKMAKNWLTMLLFFKCALREYTKLCLFAFTLYLENEW